MDGLTPVWAIGSTSDFVTNSYGASWYSFCEKLWVPVWRPMSPMKLKITKTPKLKMLGPLCSQTVNLKTDSILQYFFYFQAQQRLKENHASFNLCSKRFQSSYCVIIWAGAKRNGRGREKRKRLPASTPHDFGKTPLDISRFGSFVYCQAI